MEKLAEDSINEIAPEIAAAQKDQLFKGQDSPGGKIQWQKGLHPYPYTKQYKKRKEKLPDGFN